MSEKCQSYVDKRSDSGGMDVGHSSGMGCAMWNGSTGQRQIKGDYSREILIAVLITTKDRILFYFACMYGNG